MTTLGELHLEDAARQAAGNWRQFQCFHWFRAGEIDDAGNWAVIYSHHRDSGLLDQSNAHVIERAMEPFTKGKNPDVVLENHSHWAVGFVTGFSVRVFKRGRITKAFQTYHQLARQMSDYPILNEDDYSLREQDATLENIADSAWRLKKQFLLPDGFESDVYSWLAEHNDRAIENTDDRGGYPDESELEAAFTALGFPGLHEEPIWKVQSMNVSELIAELAAIQAEHGDIDVFIHQDGDDRYSFISSVNVDTHEPTTVSIHIAVTRFS